MPDIGSAWSRYPGYRIDLVPWPGRARVTHGDLVLADTDAALIVEESDHVARLYVPEADVDWSQFERSEHHTICPFKGEADYWTLTASDPPEANVVWAYRTPMDEVAGLAGHVAFYHDRVRVELEERFPVDPDRVVVTGFPRWGDAADLLRLIDVEPVAPGRFRSPPYPDPPLGTFLPGITQPGRRPVIEGGHLLGQAIVAASKAVPGQRVTSASMIFAKAASFDEDVAVDVDVVRRGRSFSTIETRTSQSGQLRSVGLVLLDAGADDVIRGVAPMPDVGLPLDAVPLDMSVTGRELRVVDGAYRRQPDETGPPEIHTWIRFRDRPDEPHLHAALVAQATTHWTIAAAMRPHRGVTEALAHVTLSTGPMAVDIAFHDEVDVTEWMLYTNPAVYAGRGQAQGQARVYAEDGRLLATYSVHAMVRKFAVDPATLGKDYSNAM